MFNKLPHISWSINGVDEAGYTDLSPKPVFKFSYTGVAGSTPADSYKTAINNRLNALVSSGKNKLAVFISGKDSEIIAIQCKKLNIDFEMYFLNIPGINDYMIENVNKVSAALSTPVNIITLNKDDVVAFAETSFELTRILKPTYLVVPFMFDKIPADRHIIIGEGDINKDGQSYSVLSSTDTGFGIPISSTEIAYLLHSKKSGLDGDYYFHSSSIELIKTVWDSPLLTKAYPYFSNQKMIEAEWGQELIFTEKTTNWDTVVGKQFNADIRKHLSTKYSAKFDVLLSVVPKEVL